MNEPDTRSSLIGRVQTLPWDDVAWGEFDAQYRSLILRLARLQGVPEADAKDIAQSVMIEMTTRLAEFVYNRDRCRFRSWLYTCVEHRIIDWRRRIRAQDQKLEALKIETEIDSTRVAPARWDEEWKRFLIEGALERLSRTRQLDGRSRQILNELYARRRTPEETADLLGRRLQAVYQVNFRWKEALAEVLEELRRELDS